nr:DUF4158 domain-containing protein [Burkholderia ubonensis]
MYRLFMRARHGQSVSHQLCVRLVAPWLDAGRRFDALVSLSTTRVRHWRGINKVRDYALQHMITILGDIPDAIVDHVRAAADIGNAARFGYDTASSPTLFRHYASVRAYLEVQPYYGTDANAIATRAAHTASLTMGQPVDIINATIDELIARNIELPAFSTLD